MVMKCVNEMSEGGGGGDKQVRHSPQEPRAGPLCRLLYSTMGVLIIISQSLNARFITKVFAGVLSERHLCPIVVVGEGDEKSDCYYESL